VQPRLAPFIAAVFLVLLVPGCGGGTTDSERKIGRTVVDVVERNMIAAEGRDAHAYCATFTDHYLHDRFKAGYGACVSRFKGPAAAIERSSDPRFLNAEPLTDTQALVHFTLGKARELDYVMKLTRAPAGSPAGTRWLIDARAQPVQG
jgi:hypothetical protein